MLDKKLKSYLSPQPFFLFVSLVLSPYFLFSVFTHTDTKFLSNRPHYKITYRRNNAL